MIHTTIKEQIKQAMISKDAFKLTVLRGVLAAFMNEIVAKKTNDEFLGDEEALAIIRRLVKQRKDSIEQFTKGGRPELAEDEEKELRVLETYLPQMMSKEEVMKVVEEKKANAGEIDKSKLGQFIGMVMKELKGKADGALVKEAVEEMFK
ncbi:MAG: GatB/YqeY domain-containing protein [Candidatus Paceibacterota bacterium]|jgi:hypothetical protein